jgi:hypothetical protein
MDKEHEWCAREEREISSDQFVTVDGTRLHKLVSRDGSPESFHRATDGVEVETDGTELKERQEPPEPPGFEMSP